MRKSKFSESQIVAILKERFAGGAYAAERLSAAAALTFLTFCAWCPGKLNLPGCAGLGVSRRGW